MTCHTVVKVLKILEDKPIGVDVREKLSCSRQGMYFEPTYVKYGSRQYGL